MLDIDYLVHSSINADLLLQVLRCLNKKKNTVKGMCPKSVYFVM